MHIMPPPGAYASGERSAKQILKAKKMISGDCHCACCMCTLSLRLLPGRLLPLRLLHGCLLHGRLLPVRLLQGRLLPGLAAWARCGQSPHAGNPCSTTRMHSFHVLRRPRREPLREAAPQQGPRLHAQGARRGARGALMSRTRAVRARCSSQGQPLSFRGAVMSRTCTTPFSSGVKAAPPRLSGVWGAPG